MSGLHQTSEIREGVDNIIYWMGVQFSSFGEDCTSAQLDAARLVMIQVWKVEVQVFGVWRKEEGQEVE